MRKFALKCAILCLPLLVLNTIFYFVADRVYFKPYSSYSLNYRAYVLGDSHGEALSNLLEEYGIYNFSTASDSYIDMYRKLCFLLANNHAIDTIYITVDDHTLSPYRDSGNEDRSLIFTLSGADNYFEYIINRYIKHFLVLTQPNSLTAAGLSIVAYIKKIVNPDTTEEEIVFSALDKNRRIENARARISGQFPSKKPSEKMEQTLRNIIMVCQKNNIRLVGIKFPVSGEYAALLDGRNYGADMILQSHANEVLDFQDLFISHDEYFSDQDHLNERGAREFVIVLIQDLIAVGLLPPGE